MASSRLAKILFVLLVVACAIPYVSAPIALVLGVIFALAIGNPWPKQTSSRSKQLLQASVVLLGFGMNLPEVLRTGREAFFYTIVGIATAMTVGTMLGTWLKTPKRTSLLISFGTAICGGSAIAAMAPVLEAEPEETAVALATIFLLNSAALLVFPPVGHLLGMGQRPFGLWAALAIHDTSSVVGASAAYGAGALAVGTTVKLTRALWIMPSALVASWFSRGNGKAAFPLFILGFLATAGVRTMLPQFTHIWEALHAIARQSLVATLFLIGAGLSRQTLAKTGARPMIQGVALWVIVSVGSAFAIVSGWIR